MILLLNRAHVGPHPALERLLPPPPPPARPNRTGPEPPPLRRWHMHALPRSDPAASPDAI